MGTIQLLFEKVRLIFNLTQNKVVEVLVKWLQQLHNYLKEVD